MHVWALIPSQLLFAASAVGCELLNRSKTRGREGRGFRILGCQPYSCLQGSGISGPMSVGFLGVHGPDYAYRFQGAGPAGALASLEDLYPDCGNCSCPRGIPRVCGHACDSRVLEEGSYSPRDSREGVWSMPFLCSSTRAGVLWRSVAMQFLGGI